MADNIKITIDGENKTGNAFGGVEKNVNDLHGAAGNLQTKALGPLNNMMGNVLKASAAALAATLGGLVATIGSSVKAAMGMEQQLADIQASMGATNEETGKLKKLIGDLGFDPKLKVSAAEAADAIGTLGTAGLSVDEILSGAARSTVLLANATGADFADAAAIATDVMKQFNIKAGDLQKAVNGITSTTIASKFDINDYKLALAQAGGVAATVGVDFDDFNATIAAISPYFSSGSDAGTSFKTMLQRLIPQSADAAEQMDKLGLTSVNTSAAMTYLKDKGVAPTNGSLWDLYNQVADVYYATNNLEKGSAEATKKFEDWARENGVLQSAFFSTSGEMKSMGEISAILNRSFTGLTDVQKNQALATIFGTDAMRAAAAMSGFTEASFAELKATMAKTDAEQSAATRMNTLSGVMEILWGVVESLQLQIGDAFIPVLRKMAEMFTEQAQVQGPRIVAMFQQLAGQVGVALERFLPWVEQAIPKMIAQIPVVVMGMINFGQQVISVATNIYNAVAPVVQWIAQFVGLKEILTTVGVLMAVSVVAQVVTFIAGIVSAVSAVVSFVGAVGGAIPILGGVLAAIGPVVAIVGALGVAAYALYQAWQNNFLGIRDITGQALDWIRNAISNFPQTLASARDAFFSWGNSAIMAIRDGFLAAQNWARNGLDIVMDFIQQGRDQRLGPFVQSLYNMGQSAFTKLGEGFRAAGGLVTGEFNRVMTDVQNQGAAFAAGAFAGRLYEAARGAMLRFAEGLRSVAPNLGSDMNAVLGGMVNAFNGVMDSFRNHVYGVAADIGNRIKGGLASVNLGGVMNGALWSLIDGFNSVMDSFRNHVWGVMTGIGGRIGDGLAQGIRNSMNNVMNALNWITSVAPQWVRDALGIHSPSTVFADIGTNIMAGLAEGIAGATAMPEMALAGATGGMMAAPVSTVNRNVSNTYNITNTGSTATGDPIEQVRALRSAYGGTR